MENVKSFKKKAKIKGRCALFGAGFLFGISLLMGCIVSSKYGFGVPGYFISVIVATSLELLLASLAFYRYYITESFIYKDYTFAPWKKPWVCSFNDIKYVLYTGNISVRGSPPAVMKVVTKTGLVSQNLHFVDYDRKKLKIFAELLKNKEIEIINRFSDYDINHYL
ncbi:hypothetical protein [Fulvivirga sediminis]|uniref:Lipoprotein n=1 Tax=Fulvivirga sediminis TaxID=2803949 RepID=A0A937F9J6_9BACT|nr:hypothetical protein [Fulvivirga sediminis]MBL3657119.1 hypothetical protein [Fulvivirga sediminis]